VVGRQPEGQGNSGIAGKEGWGETREEWNISQMSPLCPCFPALSFSFLFFVFFVHFFFVSTTINYLFPSHASIIIFHNSFFVFFASYYYFVPSFSFFFPCSSFTLCVCVCVFSCLYGYQPPNPVLKLKTPPGTASEPAEPAAVVALSSSDQVDKKALLAKQREAEAEVFRRALGLDAVRGRLESSVHGGSIAGSISGAIAGSIAGAGSVVDNSGNSVHREKTKHKPHEHHHHHRHHRHHHKHHGHNKPHAMQPTTNHTTFAQISNDSFFISNFFLFS
jgi:hypothetical protein